MRRNSMPDAASGDGPTVGRRRRRRDDQLARSDAEVHSIEGAGSAQGYGLPMASGTNGALASVSATDSRGEGQQLRTNMPALRLSTYAVSHPQRPGGRLGDPKRQMPKYG
jgi:hypothetical protein